MLGLGVEAGHLGGSADPLCYGVSGVDSTVHQDGVK